MTDDQLLSNQSLERYLWTLDIVYREGKHLLYSWHTLFKNGTPLDLHWVESLEASPDEAVKLEAFVSRFGRLQDTIADKLIPRWLQRLAETPGSQIENLNKVERLGVLDSTEQWLAARQLRNQLIHEYMEDAGEFLAAVQSAAVMCQLLIRTYNNLSGYQAAHYGADKSRLPQELPIPV